MEARLDLLLTQITDQHATMEAMRLDNSELRKTVNNLLLQLQSGTTGPQTNSAPADPVVGNTGTVKKQVARLNGIYPASSNQAPRAKLNGSKNAAAPSIGTTTNANPTAPTTPTIPKTTTGIVDLKGNGWIAI